ncbi:MAG: ATP-binding cassette subfamily B protein [Maribacter sp.]
MRFPFYEQPDSMDCGVTCLRMISKHYGKHYSMEYLRDRSYVDREGVSLMGISDAAEAIGMRTVAAKVTYDQLVDDVPLPAILHWEQDHFLVIYKISKNNAWVADPKVGKIKYSKKEFLKKWASDVDEDGTPEGITMMLEPMTEFYEQDGEKANRKKWWHLYQHVWRYKALLAQLVLGLLVGSLLQLIFPFLTQSIVDYGIDNQDLSFIYIILIAQLVLFFSQTAISFIRSWILLHIGMRVNISLISDFLIKLMRLPLHFFDIKMTGDILQRIQDHRRIEVFLTSSTLNALFSVFTVTIFSAVLFLYNPLICAIFLISTVFYIVWILFFLKKRKILDHRRFEKQAENHNVLIELIHGMHEIKLHNAEKEKRWKWEGIQAGLYRVGVKSLALGQWQTAGATFINEFKNIIISFIAAKSVIDGDMTLGMMLAVQYIIGQMNGPVQNFMSFIQMGQDAQISLERLAEIHDREDEELLDEKINILPENGDIHIEDMSFRYSGPDSPWVLKEVDLLIPQGKTTAIVGTSGSGKTTLLKLILNFYQPTKGKIKMGDLNIMNIQSRLWRKQCGVVMQEGYIFSDTIAKNITLGDDKVDRKKLLKAAKTANIQGFIEGLPLGYNTKIGKEGVGLSQGQKQRILIARAVYKDPQYIFFDEATNSLDAYNEMIIMENLEEFFKGRTVIVVAHRLSTVKDADNIVVLADGELIEQGPHSKLTALKGAYYHLVKNQLELGS